MRKVYGVILFFVMTLGFSQQNVSQENPIRVDQAIKEKQPEFFILDWKHGTRLRGKPTELFVVLDSMPPQKVVMWVDETDQPVLYSAEITTPVCADGDCRLMDIQFYWTLLGGYAGFDRYLELPLTKHDHDEFLMGDYLKLHRLLIDKHSVLGRRSIDALVEKRKTKNKFGVDALSGATVAAVKETVVAGALYTCHIAWNLVHGKIKHQIKAHALSRLNASSVKDMLYSNNVDYQLFALNGLSEDQYLEHNQRIGTLFKTAIPLVRTLIAKNLPEAIWVNPALQKPFWDSFSVVDGNSKSLLFNYLERADSNAIDNLSFQLGAMSKNQIKKYLQNLERKGRISKIVKDNLLAFANSKEAKYAYIISTFLQEQRQ